MKNIFVGNLNSSTSEGALRQLFVAFGPVDQVKIMIDSYTGKSRGFGFVEMANAEDGEKAIADLNGALLDERALNVNEAPPGSSRESPETNMLVPAVVEGAGNSPLQRRGASVEDGNTATAALNGTNSAAVP